MPNHLVVGLGGNGGKIIRSFRKLIYQNHRSEDPAGISLRFLYVDSSDEMMAHDDPTWKILGTSVQLQKTSQLLIKGINLEQVLNNLGDYPGIGPWLGSREQFRVMVASQDAGNVFGGQKRRLGRFLFACKVVDFQRQTKQLVSDMQNGGTVETVFHVCTGLAGGTGSGSVIDVICQLRQNYQDATRYKIIVYGALPELDPPARKDTTGNYHANAYAALLELNALAVGAYQPWDVSCDVTGRLTVRDPFNCCYLFSDENEAGNRVNYDEELPNIVASFLYQKIVAEKDFIWDSLKRQEGFENMGHAKEPECSPATKKPLRSRQFFSFGVKQIAYPEQEIRELLTYEFARQAALQLRFNNWTESSGYSEDAVNQSFNAIVTQKEILENWLITDEHLCLSLGILKDEMNNRRWKQINVYWTDQMANFQSLVRETLRGKEKTWLTKLSQLFEEAFSQNYREAGVQKFYQIKADDMKDQVREIRRRIETELFADWRNGARSMTDVSRLLDALNVSLTQRKDAMDDRVAKSRDSESSALERADANQKEWAAITFVGEFTGARERLFARQSPQLSELYTYKTRTLGLQYAKKLLEALIAELTALATEVSKAASKITEATEVFKKNVEIRCKDSGSSDVTKQVVRFYDPKAVRDFSKLLTRDKSAQTKQTNAVRQVLSSLLGEDQRFSSFNVKIETKEKFIEVLEQVCVANAEEAHNGAISSDPNLNRILRVNLVDRLAKEYGRDRDALRSYVLQVVSRARTFLAVNDAEVGRSAAGIPKDQTKIENFTIIMPDAESTEFRDLLASELRGAKPGNTELIIIPDDEQNRNKGKGREITLVNVTNVFPLRFARDAAFLRQKYEGRASAVAFQLHGEGDGTDLPSLFVRSVSPKDVFPLFLIAKALNIVQRWEDPQTGVASVYLITKNERLRDNPPMLLGQTLDSAADEATGEIFDQTEATVQTLLAGEYLHQIKREQLMASINQELDAIKAEVKNPLDKRYKTYLEAANRAEEILNKR
jgi:hypothetical protein